jgi:hypothetical protein
MSVNRERDWKQKRTRNGQPYRELMPKPQESFTDGRESEIGTLGRFEHMATKSSRPSVDLTRQTMETSGKGAKGGDGEKGSERAHTQRQRCRVMSRQARG